MTMQEYIKEYTARFQVAAKRHAEMVAKVERSMENAKMDDFVSSEVREDYQGVLDKDFEVSNAILDWADGVEISMWDGDVDRQKFTEVHDRFKMQLVIYKDFIKGVCDVIYGKNAITNRNFFASMCDGSLMLLIFTELSHREKLMRSDYYFSESPYLIYTIGEHKKLSKRIKEKGLIPADISSETLQ